MEVRLPDGRIVKNVPEGTTKAQLMQKLGMSEPTREDRRAAIVAGNPTEYDPASPEFQAKYGPTAGMSGLDNAIAGFGQQLTGLGLGAKQLAASVMPERRNLSSLINPEDTRKSRLEREASEKRELDAPLLATTGGKIGSIAGGIAATAPLLAIPGVNSLAGAAITGSGFGALQPATSDAERAVNTALGGALGLAGQYGGNKLASFAGRKIAERGMRHEASKVARQPINSLIGEAQKAGLVIPPTTAKSSGVNKLLEGFSGKLTTGQGASVMNQQTFNNLAKRSIGVADDTPLTSASVKAIRDNAGQVYNQIAKSGDVVADDKFLDDLIKLPEELSKIKKDFPDLDIEGAEEVQKLAEGLFLDKFSAESAIEVVKRLRKQSTTHFKSFDDPAKRALAFAERKAADAMDDMIARHLQKTGKGQLANQYSEARKLIAKTHSVEAALNEAGNINAKKLAQQLGKGKPLSGELELIGRFADAFPKAARETTESFPGFSPLDMGYSGIVGGGALASGSPEVLALAALPAVRALVRRGILTGPAQKALLRQPTGPGLIGNSSLRLLQGTGRISPAAGIAGSPLVRPE